MDPELPTQDKLIHVEITNENMALNVLVSFINIAHRRGVFTIEESAKIHECILKFQKTPPPTIPAEDVSLGK